MPEDIFPLMESINLVCVVCWFMPYVLVCPWPVSNLIVPTLISIVSLSWTNANDKSSRLRETIDSAIDLCDVVVLVLVLLSSSGRRTFSRSPSNINYKNNNINIHYFPMPIINRIAMNFPTCQFIFNWIFVFELKGAWAYWVTRKVTTGLARGAHMPFLPVYNHDYTGLEFVQFAVFIIHILFFLIKYQKT